MFSILCARYGSLKSVYQISVKHAHRNSGRARRMNSHLFEFDDQTKEEMLQDAEDMEDMHDWIENNMQKADFGEKVAREERKWKTEIKKKTIEHKYFKKPQETNLLTWDAKEQMRFLHNEYPDEWTVDRLAESFPVSRDGVISVLKSTFYPKSLADVVKHDKRVQLRWKELKEEKKGLLDSGPVRSRYQDLLEYAAGNPSLPMPNLNRLLLSSGQKPQKPRKPEKPGIFLSIVKEYCDKKELEAKTSVAPKNVNLLAPPSSIDEHVSQNRLLIQGVAGKLRTDNPQSTLKSESKSKFIETNELRTTPSKDLRVKTDQRNRKTLTIPSMRTLESDFDYKNEEFESDVEELESDEEDQSQNVRHKRNALASLHRDELKPTDQSAFNDSTRRAKNWAASDEVASKMEENSRLALQSERTRMRPEAGAEVKEAIRDMMVGGDKDGEFYMFSEDKGYQHPYGRKADLPKSKISVPKNAKKSDSRVLYKSNNDYYDEDGEFLFRAP